MVRIKGSGDDFYRDRGEMFIRLNRRRNATGKLPTGVYCCEIPVGDTIENFCIEIYTRENGKKMNKKMLIIEYS